MRPTTSLLLSIAILLLSQPLLAVAQTPQAPTAQTQQVLSRFNPGITSTGGGGDTFSGLNFSGVGGAVLSCTNIGSTISGSVSDLFKNAKDQAEEDAIEDFYSGFPGMGNSGQEQPVTDKKATEQLKKQTQRENCLNAVAYAVSKNMLQQVTNRTLTWINTGLSGNPLYVRNPDSFLRNIRDQKLTSFLQNVPNDNPIFGNAIRSAITQQVTGYSDGRLNQVMDSPEGRAYQAFQNDFTQGGWNAFLNPRNNALGAYFNAVDNISGQINTAQQNIQNELVQGNGFLSVKKCVEWRSGDVESVRNGCINTYQSVRTAQYASCDEVTDPGIKEGCKNAADDDYTASVNSCVQSQRDAPTQANECLREEIVTPGSVIASQAATISTSAVRQLEQADQINEVLGSFFDQFLSRLFSDGLGGLSGRNSAFGGANVVLGTNGLPIESANLTSAEQAFGYQQISGGFNGEFDISRPQQLRAVIKTQIDFINRTKDSQVAMSRIIPTLGKLDYCVPGPNPSWKVGTDYNAELTFSAFAGKAPSKALGNTISSLSSIPGPGTVIALVGNAVGAIVNFGGGNEPTSIETRSLQLFDKVTNSGRQIRDYYMSRPSGLLSFADVDLLAGMQSGYSELITSYNAAYGGDTIKRVLIAADRTNPTAYATARATEILDETNALTYYNQSIVAFEQENIANITQTQEALAQLNSINAEAAKIVFDAKKRYIAANPSVNLACLNNAYNVTLNADGTVPDVTGTVVIPATGATRYETDVVDPMVVQSRNARIYFYSRL